MIGGYRPGRSPLHRLRPGAKLLGLIAFAIVTVWVPGVLATVGMLTLAVLLTVAAGLRARDYVRIARGFALIAVALFVFQAWQRGWEHGVEVVGGLFALILAAHAVTTSTRADDMLETITWALTPLRPLGVHPERVALAFSLTLRALPLISALAGETRSAARARGLERNPRAYATPLVIRSVAHARALGDALHARGVGDDAQEARVG